jgi:hypothetical protein
LIERALDLAQRLDERRAIASANRQLGELHELRHEHELADQRFHHALAILTEAGMIGARAEYTAAYQEMLDARADAAPLERSAG